MKVIVTMLCLLALAGCATPVDYESWAKAVESQQQFATQAAAGCQTDLCRYVVVQEATAKTIRAPQPQVHPGWQTLDRVLSMGLPMYFGYKQSEVWAGALTGAMDTVSSMDRSYTNNSVNIGRDQIAGTQDNSSWADNSDRSNRSDNSRHNYDYSDNSSWADNSDHSDNSNNSDNRDYRSWSEASPDLGAAD